MTKTTKAVLLSALVFPGTGHVFLKKYLPGGALVSVALGCLYYLVTKSIEIALSIAEKIQSGEVPHDAVGLSEFVATQMSAMETPAQDIATTVLIIVWVTGILDSYRIARAQNMAATKVKS